MKPLLHYFSCVLRSLSVGKVNLRPSLRSWALWRRFFVQDISFPRLQPVVLSLQLKNPPQHDAAGTMLHCWDCIGQVMSSAWFSPHIPLRIRPKSSILVSSDQRILFVIILESFRCFLANSMRAFMCLALRRASVGPLCHKAPTGGGLQWWLTFYNFLPSPECISGAQPQWSLGSSLPLSPRLFSPQ